MFFEGTDPVHVTMRHVADKLHQAGIDYAIVGGMAVNAHNHHRTTGDVDFLPRPDDFKEFVRQFVPSEFERIPGRPRRFLDPTTDVTFDILVTGLFPGSGKPGPIAFPNPAAVSRIIEGRHVVGLATLIELKLAAGRYQDLGDVVALIRENKLDETFAAQLHVNVARDFIECLEEKRREDEYELRQDEQFIDQTGGPPDAPS
jgi:hypothetical protein